jgi:hypothetical protein
LALRILHTIHSSRSDFFFCAPLSSFKYGFCVHFHIACATAMHQLCQREAALIVCRRCAQDGAGCTTCFSFVSARCCRISIDISPDIFF